MPQITSLSKRSLIKPMYAVKSNRIIVLFVLITQLLGCSQREAVSSVDPVNWQARTVSSLPSDSLTAGTTYLSIYSQIYSQTEHRTHDLTATVSIRNTNQSDTIFVEKAQYFDTHGELIETYFNQTIFIAPLETVEIVIDEIDRTGGTGANFLFNWRVAPNQPEPLFEAVMISTLGQQGLSFTTQGKRIK